MRVLLTSTASHVPPRGGSTRSNLVWLNHLVEAGHQCRVVAGAAERDTPAKEAQFRKELAEQQLPEPQAAGDGVEIATLGTTPVYSVLDPARRVAVLREQIHGFVPDWVLVSSEDLGQLLLREAHRAAPGRVVYLAHTPQFYPFGPASWNPSSEGADLVKRSAAVVAIGRHTAAYIREHTGREAAVIHPPIYGAGPFPMLGRFDSGYLTMVNPCGIKGISIFLALAERLPEYSFAALPGWGTTSGDRRALESLPNVTLLPHCRDIEEVLVRTRVLLMPSLWFEGFGLIAMEALLRGIPVIASDAGGLVEAKMGTNYVIPVRAIETYEPHFDERHLPQPVLPPQNIEPWMEAVRSLLADRTAYEAEAEASRQAALRFVASLNEARFDDFLARLTPAAADAPSEPRDIEAALANLSPAKRALLLQRLKKQGGTT